MAFLKEIGKVRNADVTDPEQARRSKLAIVAETFVELQEARHEAEYDIAEPYNPRDAEADVAQARQVFLIWPEVKDDPLAQRYLYSLLFKDRV